ncbi:cation transporter [bacterium]|nr:cation transporter [bacterium]
MHINSQKKLAISISLTFNLIIIVLKFIASYISGSICLLSEAVHSIADCLASSITFFAIKRSSLPADKEHPFGHGKYEDMAGFIEGIMIIFASAFILYEASKKIIFGYHENIDSTLGIYVMGIAMAANIIAGSYSLYVAKKSNSISLYADAQHLKTDVYSSLGVLIGLVAIKLTGINILDSIIALIVAGIIFKAGFLIAKQTLNNLLDGSVSNKKISEINEILLSCKDIKGFKDLKARNLGPMIKVEITIFLEDSMKLSTCHQICDNIENKISEKIGDVTVHIHAEPVSIQQVNV